MVLPVYDPEKALSNVLEAHGTNLNSDVVVSATLLHLALQGKQSMNGAACRYRGERGRRCAVGFWIPEAKWKTGSVPEQEPSRFEDYDPVSLFKTKLLADGLDLELFLLGNLQRFHDSEFVWISKEAFGSACTTFLLATARSGTILSSVKKCFQEFAIDADLLEDPFLDEYKVFSSLFEERLEREEDEEPIEA